MIAVDKVVLREMKKYDDKLFIKWNNEHYHFEVWRKMLWGDRIITPVINSIYEGRDNSFCPLDSRLLAWLFSADSQRRGLNKNWKWRTDKRFKEIALKTKTRTQSLYKDIAKDNYSLVNAEMLGMHAASPEISDWVKPDIQNRSGRTMLRSADNVIERFGEDE